MRLLLSLVGLSLFAAEPAVQIATPMPPPAWAMLERKLLEANSIACDRFAKKYLDSRGYLMHTPRWGTLDGPDDAIGARIPQPHGAVGTGGDDLASIIAIDGP